MKSRRLLLLNFLFALMCLIGCGEMIDTEANEDTLSSFIDQYHEWQIEKLCPDVGLTYQTWETDPMGERELKNYTQCYTSMGRLTKTEFYTKRYESDNECSEDYCMYSYQEFKYYETFYDICVHNRNWDTGEWKLVTCSSFDYEQLKQRHTEGEIQW